MDFYGFISLLSIVGGCSVRSRVIALAGGAGSQVTFKPDPTELADYILIYRIRGAGIGTNVTFQVIAPPVVGVYDIVDDDLPIALGGSRDLGLEVSFVNKSAPARQIEVDFARFSQGQLDDLRCLVGFPSQAAAALTLDALSKIGISGSAG